MSSSDLLSEMRFILLSLHAKGKELRNFGASFFYSFDPEGLHD